MLAAIEDATDGWGMRLDFWAPGALDVDNPALQFLVFALPMLAFAFLGMAIGVVFKRWGAVGLYVLAVATLLLTGLAAFLATWQKAWQEIGHWLADLSVTSLTIALPLLLAVALAGLTFLGIRRTVP